MPFHVLRRFSAIIRQTPRSTKTPQADPAPVHEFVEHVRELTKPLANSGENQ
jgi:hypothetical protein